MIQSEIERRKRLANEEVPVARHKLLRAHRRLHAARTQRGKARRELAALKADWRQLVNGPLVDKLRRTEAELETYTRRFTQDWERFESEGTHPGFFARWRRRIMGS